MLHRRFLILLFLVVLLQPWAFAQAVPAFLAIRHDGSAPGAVETVKPLQHLVIVNSKKRVVSVADGRGKVYVTGKSGEHFSFVAAGAPGRHTVTLTGKSQKEEFHFQLEATTSISDNGSYEELFNMLRKGLDSNGRGIKWNGRNYRFFVPWVLDHAHTMKGMKYFKDYGGEFVDMMRLAQREDGMIYSFVQYMPNPDYFRTRDEFSGYTKKIGDRYFVRQPTENHPEYNFVNTVHQWWLASGDHGWMKANVDACAKALDYCLNDPARWSNRFKLLKRVYTIDSWDFQVDDEYTPDIGLTNSMIIDPVKSKFGVFFGDNTGYILACRELAEMYSFLGNNAAALTYSERASELENRLNELAWNGKFYTHYIDEDPSVKRNLGVDEKSQLAMSNTYTINRGLDHQKSKAIIESYLQLKAQLPVGAPAEWFNIYPPFERGFGTHGEKWEYMNGGVGGHVAGELAKGAFSHGYEQYGTDILNRVLELGRKYNNKIYFGYTGSIPPAPAPNSFKALNLRPWANMDFRVMKKGGPVLDWMGGTRDGDDLSALPAGKQRLAGIDFDVIDPSASGGRAVVAVARRNGYPEKVEIPVNEKAGALYFLHTSGKPSSENVSGAVTLAYSDGTKVTRYMMMGKQLTYWWFSELSTEHSGIAWYGENRVSKGVGLSWFAMDNPHPDKVISSVTLHAAQDETIYTVLAISLAERKHFVPVKGPSFGGPDNWSAATIMSALVEGLAGVKDSPRTQKFSYPLISPRWCGTASDTVNVTVHYPASEGYVSYRYLHLPGEKKIVLSVAGSGAGMNFHLMAPPGGKPVELLVNGTPSSFQKSVAEATNYADFTLSEKSYAEIVLLYEQDR